MSVQIVFLIDTDIVDCYTDSSALLSNSVCLACFRLLHAYSSHKQKGGNAQKSKLLHTNVKWGYKFFNRQSFYSRIESHKFYDFKLKYFEEFENEVQRRFENETSRSTDTQNSAAKSFKPVDNINRAVTELLADFQWESTDLFSPVKGKRARKGPKQYSNLVFLFTKCPKNPFHLKEFTGKQVPDEDVFLSSLLPYTLLKQFCDVAKISLHWIDTQHNNFMKDAEIPSVNIIERSINKIGGCLLLLDALCAHGSPYFTDISLLTDKDSNDLIEEEVAQYTSKDRAESTQLLPITAVFRTISNLAINKSVKTEGEHLNDDVILRVGNIEIQLAIIPTTDPAFDKYETCSEKNSDPSASQQFSPRVLQTYGMISKSSTGAGLTVPSSFVCSEAIPTVPGDKSEAVPVGRFENLLSELAAKNSCLVLLCKDSGQLVLLEPLTLATASLCVFSKGTSLQLEKQLLEEETSRVVTPNSNENCDTLVNRLVSSVQITRQNEDEESPAGNTFTGRQLDRWVIPGPPKTVQKLVAKLNQRISELDFLSAEEVCVLKQLQKSYKLENRPPGLRDTPVTDNAATEFKTEPVALDKLELPSKGKASRTSLSRADMILYRAQERAKETGQCIAKNDGGNKSNLPDKEKPEIAAQLTDFSSIEELTHYLTSSYERVSSGEVTSIDSTIQSMVTVAIHYTKKMNSEEAAIASCEKLLEETIFKSVSQLREKYSQNSDLSLDQKIAEYESQVILRLEVISSLQPLDQEEGFEGNDEIIGLLRTLSFISEPGYLSKFMQSCLLNNYIHTRPRTLANIYDELMQPLPESLANLLSPEESSPDQSVLNDSLASVDNTGGPPSTRTRSHGSVGPPSSQPGSNHSVNLDNSMNRSRGGRKLVHHYSLADFGAKRQIVVPKMPSQKSGRSAKKKKDGQKKPRDKVAKALFAKSKGGTKLERRQSVAVMQHSHKTPKKNQLSKSPRRVVTPRRKLVAETPSHKQLSSILHKGPRHRNVSGADDMNMDIVEESPVKMCNASYQDSPTKGKRAKALLRRSFYSAGPVKRTKNLSQYFQLADKIAGRQRHPSTSNPNKPAKLLSFETPAEFKSPDKNSSFLLSQFVVSPSPAKRTPRKLTKTPKKVLDSPCHNTRSKLFASPGVGLIGSPASRRILDSPSLRLLQSPLSRRQSPQVLAPESDVKTGPVCEQTTPEKSPVCGLVTSGLDSPSQNTRLRTSQTPTRKSVRAALFARSPAPCKTRSPVRVAASPRTLLDKFGSPSKFPSISKPVNRDSPKKLLSRDSPRKLPASESLMMDSYLKNSSMSNTKLRSSSAKKSDNAPNSQTTRTPSPKPKKVTKTPDSFDKWHRRKPRMSQSSPSMNKFSPPTNMQVFTGNQSEEFPNQSETKSDLAEKSLNIKVDEVQRKKRDLLLSPEKIIGTPSKRRKIELTDDLAEESKPKISSPKVIKGNVRTKRNLMSPDKALESPYKRRNTKTDSDFNRVYCPSSQGFDTTGSFNELSQISNTSSIDYFSASNDEVFLSQNSNTYDAENIENSRTSVKLLHKKRSLLSSFKESSSPRNKSIQRVVSNDFPFTDNSDSERSESPIFGNSAKRSNRARNISGDKTLNQIRIRNLSGNKEKGLDLGHNSPVNPVISPNAKKYSPNVSAKSLMHLIQSPLLRSPDNEGKKSAVEETSPRRTAVGQRSRRSLKMQN